MPVDPVEKTSTGWSYVEFKEQLVRAESHLPPSELSLPPTIETGAIGKELIRLEAETNSDPSRRERATVLKLNADGQLMMKNVSDVGTYHEVGASASIGFVPGTTVEVWVPGKNERVVMTLHSHPNDSPPSAQDLTGTVITQETRQANVAEMIGTSNLNYLLLRTMQTAEVSPSEIDTWRTTWEEEFKQRARSLPMMLTDDHLRAKTAVAQYSVFRDMCNAHNVAVYTAPKGSTEYTRAKL